MRVIMLFFMDDKFSNYKIDPDNQMYFLDITGLRVVIKNCKLFRDQPQWHEWQKDFGTSIIFKKMWNWQFAELLFESLPKQIGDIRNSLAHNSFMKLSEELFSKQLHTIKHVLVQIDLSEDLDENNVFKMAQVRCSSLLILG